MTALRGGGAAAFDCRFDLMEPAAARLGYLDGHLPDARRLDLDRDLSGAANGTNGRHPLPDPAALAATLRAAGFRTGMQAIGYDDGDGAGAARLWWLLRWLGHDAVAVLDGGLAGWRAAGLPLETGAPPPPIPGDFAGGEGDAATVADAAALLADLDTGDRLVVDARAPTRFAGEAHPLDAVAGRIPGARNRFFRDNLDADGRFRPAHELRAAFAAVLGGTPPAAAVMQCGSGVTACHNLLAMAVAGLPGARLYPGSWSEWASDPTRPVERG